MPGANRLASIDQFECLQAAVGTGVNPDYFSTICCTGRRRSPATPVTSSTLPARQS
jgi:hypothetical protein